MNVNELKLKPCPFCGSDDISFSAFSLSPDAYALCEHCNAGIEIQVGWGEMTEKEHDEVCNLELQKVWNRRAVEQPQLNENQQIVLSWLKIKHFDSYFKAAVSDLFFYVRHDDIEGFPNLNYRKLVEGYKQLSDKEFAQVLEVFSRWAQEREEE